MRERSRRVAVTVTALALAALSGCADIPTSGPVHVGRPLSAIGGLGDVDVRVQPPQAQPGMSPTDVVRGFLRAVVNNDGDFEIARTYLSGRAAQTWNAAGTTTYDDSSVQLTPGPRSGKGRSVVLRVQRRGFIDERGEFTPRSGPLQSTFRLVRQRGEWRIDQLADGVLLSTSDVQRAFRLGTLYFVDRTHTSLVPEQVFFRPQSRGLATSLVLSLLDGPGPWLAPAVHTGFPRGVVLLGNVAVDQDGTAEVNLSGAVRQASAEQLRELAAQLVWTLVRDSQVAAVRLLADSSPLNVPDAPDAQTLSTWRELNPAPTVDLPAFYAHGGGWRSAEGGSNPSLRSAVGLSDLSMSADGRVLAAVDRQSTGDRLLTWHSGAHPESRLQADELTRPATDPAGDMFVVARTGRHREVDEVTAAGEVAGVRAPQLTATTVQALSLSRDGSRVAAVVGPPGRGRLLVGRVQSGRSGLAFAGFRNVLPTWTDISGVAWEDAEQLVVTAADRPGGHRRLVSVDADGYFWRLLATDGVRGEPVDVAAAPGQPMVVLAGGSVWSARTAGEWRRIAMGRQPGYAG